MIQQEGSQRARLTSAVLRQLVAPLTFSILITVGTVAFVSHFGLIQRDLVFEDVLKFFSLLILGRHTLDAALQIHDELGGGDKSFAIRIYRFIGGYAVVVAFLTSAHFFAVCIPEIARPQNDFDSLDWLALDVSSFAHNAWVLFTLAVLSFIYLFGFLAGNIIFQRQNPRSLGIERFTQAFIYGANMPFIMAALAVLTVSIVSQFYDVLGVRPETFLVGSVTFLIFSSTAANICVDIYARPYLKLRKIEDCVFSGSAPIAASQ